jgi:hypothetical protein
MNHFSLFLGLLSSCSLSGKFTMGLGGANSSLAAMTYATKQDYRFEKSIND